MKWEPSDAVFGDVIRVRLGSIWHYGIFVSPDEVIAFGLPPVDEFRDRPDRFNVISTDIDLFCCGMIPEKAVPDRAEAKKKRSAEETVSAARARIGEGGYNIISFTNALTGKRNARSRKRRGGAGSRGFSPSVSPRKNDFPEEDSGNQTFSLTSGRG